MKNDIEENRLSEMEKKAKHKTDKDLYEEMLNYKSIYDFSIPDFRKHIKNHMIPVIGITIGCLIVLTVFGIRMNKSTASLQASAESYFNAGNYGVAVEDFSKLAKKDNENSKWNAKIGEIYAIRGDEDSSVNYLDKSRKVTKVNEDGLNTIVIADLINKDYGQALKDGEYALKKLPKSRKLQRTLFAVYLANNNGEKAKQILSTYNIDRNSASDMAQYAKMNVVIKNWDQAFSTLKEAWQADKNSKVLKDTILEWCLNNKNFVIKYLANLEKQNPKEETYKEWIRLINSTNFLNVDKYKLLIPQVVEDQKSKSNQEPFFVNALENEPYNYNIALYAANHFWNKSKDDNDKAFQYFDLAQLIAPNEAEVKYELAIYSLSNGHEKDAIAYLQKAIQLNNYEAKYHRTLGTILMSKENKIEALKQIKYAYKLDPNDILTLNNAGCYYILVSKNFYRGVYNIKEAMKAINDKTDSYISSTIKSNYEKARNVQKLDDKGKLKSIRSDYFGLFY